MDREEGWRGVGARLLARPDALMLEVGAGGELLVARVRALLSTLLLPLPLFGFVFRDPSYEVIAGLVGAVVANIGAQVWLALARRRRRHPWLPFATGTYDVTAVTLLLGVLALRDPAAGINSAVVWCIYLIAIGMTGLRNDGRLTLYVGGLALLQFLLLAIAVFTLAAPEQLQSASYGIASPASVLHRCVLLVIATLMTAAVAYRMQRLVEMSGHDSLTGLPNRAWLLQRMPHVFAAARNGGGSLTLALIDIDRFQRINDEAGHLAGDRVLRHFGASLSEMLQDNEMAVRIGGQEFVVVMHGPAGGAWERLDRLRRAMAQRRFLPELGEDAFLLSFSAGLAAWPTDGGHLSALLGTGDRRLRAAKAAGGDRVVARDA